MLQEPYNIPYNRQKDERELLKRVQSIPSGIVMLLIIWRMAHLPDCRWDLVFLQVQIGHKNLRTTISYIGLCLERQRYINHPILSLSIKYRV